MSKVAWHTLVLFLETPVLRHGVVSKLENPEPRLDLEKKGKLCRLLSASKDMRSQLQRLVRASKV